MQRHLDQLGQSTHADILVLTDDSARVFASARAGERAIERGTSLATLDAVKHALDPNAPASAELAVLRTSSGVLRGRGLSARCRMASRSARWCSGERLDSDVRRRGARGVGRRHRSAHRGTHWSSRRATRRWQRDVCAALLAHAAERPRGIDGARRRRGVRGRAGVARRDAGSAGRAALDAAAALAAASPR